MNILIIQERGRHDANRHFRESCCLQRSFHKLGHECVIWGAGHENFQTPPDFNSFDLIINLENYGDDWIPNLSTTTKPFKIIWCIDAHVRGISPYEKMFSDGKYHILAHATKDYVKESHHRWLPNCADASLLRPISTITKSHRIGFCGNHVTAPRKQAVDMLSQIFGLRQDIFVIGESMVEAINSYHIHFNMNIANDINYRSFETLACNTVLLTNYNYQYDSLGFVDGKNCFMYSDQRDLIAKTTQLIRMIEDSSLSLKRIAENGRELFLTKHTYDERAKEILNVLSKQ
jgi:hypothetical protein